MSTYYFPDRPTKGEVDAARERLARYLYSISAGNHLAWDELHNTTRDRWRSRADAAFAVIAGEER